MGKIERIEQQIRELTPAEFAELRERVLDQDWHAWDSKIESDARSGKLDDTIAEARAGFDRGKTRKL